jgi:transposase-like protein
MVTKKCPKCGRVAQVRVERTFKATEHRSSYSCAACGATWTTLHRADRRPPKRKHAWLA